MDLDNSNQSNDQHFNSELAPSPAAKRPRYDEIPEVQQHCIFILL